MIVPSSTPQLVGSVLTILSIEGAEGGVNVIGLSAEGVSQVPPTFLTITLYVPPGRLEKLPFNCQFKPPSIEYSKLVPVAETTIEPSSKLQFDGSVATTEMFVGATGEVRTLAALDWIQVPSAFLTLIT